MRIQETYLQEESTCLKYIKVIIEVDMGFKTTQYCEIWGISIFYFW